MSKLGKILIGVAALGAVVALVVGIMLILQYADTRKTLSDTQTAKAASDAAAAKSKAEAVALAKAKADSDAQLASAQAQVADLTPKLAAAQKAADDANAAVTQAKADADKAKSDLAAINATLNGASPGDLIAAKEKAEKDAQVAQDQQKIMQDQLQAANNAVDQLKKDMYNATHGGIMPPGVTGKVTFVNRTWNFVVLDVGLSNGVVPNGELIVFRGKNGFLGKIKVTSAEENSAVADILPDIKGDIQVGDSVLN